MITFLSLLPPTPTANILANAIFTNMTASPEKKYFLVYVNLQKKNKQKIFTEVKFIDNIKKNEKHLVAILRLKMKLIELC